MPSLAFAHPPLCPETWNPAGTFPTGTTIKYTEANGKDPAIEPMAANNGQGGGIATYIDWHLWGQGDLEVCNGVGCVCCRVPPPPFSDEPPTAAP